MLKYLIAFIFLTSCITQQKCQERYPSQVKDSITTVDKIIILHDTIKEKGAVVLIHDPIPCPELEYHKSITKDNLTETIDISKGVLTANCKEDSLRKIIDFQAHQISTFDDRKITAPGKDIYLMHWYDIALRWWSLITLLAIGIYLLIKFK